MDFAPLHQIFVFTARVTLRVSAAPGENECDTSVLGGRRGGGGGGGEEIKKTEEGLPPQEMFSTCGGKALQTAAPRSDLTLGQEGRGCRNGTLRLSSSPPPNPVNILPFTPPSPRPFPPDLFGWGNSMPREEFITGRIGGRLPPGPHAGAGQKNSGREEGQWVRPAPPPQHAPHHLPQCPATSLARPEAPSRRRRCSVIWKICMQDIIGI